MSFNRKQFLQLAFTGGLGALFGGPSVMPDQWKEKGANLWTVNRQSLVMGSLISFQVVAETKAAGYEAIRRAEKIFRSLERKFSMYDDYSEMAKLGIHAGKTAVSVSDEAMELLHYAKSVHRESQGLFDITVEPAMKRWGFRANSGRSIQRPTDKELMDLERIIGSKKITLEENKAFLEEPHMAIDTGGIAGGYALDKAIQEMKTCDISAAFVNFSGDIHCFGKPIEDKSWRVYILDPHTRQPLRDPIELTNEALSTSGAYQNRRHDDANHSWGHLLLPDEAEPVEPVGSVTAIHSSAMVADAWSTAVYVGAHPPSEIRTVILPKS